MQVSTWLNAFHTAAEIDRGLACMLQDIFTAMHLEDDAILYWDGVSEKDILPEEIEYQKEKDGLRISARYKASRGSLISTRTIVIKPHTRENPSSKTAAGSYKNTLLRITYKSVDQIGDKVSERLFETDILRPSSGDHPEAVFRRTHNF